MFPRTIVLVDQRLQIQFERTTKRAVLIRERVVYEKTIVCLANSRKPPSGRCIAGKLWSDGQPGPWLRPVSARPTHEVSEAERRYPDGNLAQLLDVVQIPLIEVKQFHFQRENHVLDGEYYWQKIGVAGWADVRACLDGFDPEFWALSPSTYHGLNDKIAEVDVMRFGSSLKLIEVNDFEVRVQRENGFEGRPGKRKVRGWFTYNRQGYLLSVSDADLEDQYLRGNDGVFSLGAAILCISLVEVFHEFSFRVIASVITPQRCGAAHA